MATTSPPQLYTITWITNKGKGLVATQTIPKGTLILHENPLFTALNTEDSELQLTLRIILRSLPKDPQRAFLSLHNTYSTPSPYPFSRIFKTNAIRLDNTPNSESGIYLTISRINHSCVPNAVYHRDNKKTNEVAIRAISDIEKGEEITVCYIGDLGTKDERDKLLNERSEFECFCELCTASAQQIGESDERRLRIRDLDQKIGGEKRAKENPEASLRDCGEMVSLLEQEFPGSGGGVFLGRVLHDAFQICMYHGDQARACVFAEKYAKVKAVWEGVDGEGVKEVIRWIENSENDKNLGRFSNKWQSGKGDILKGVGEKEFKKWLFRLERKI